MVLFSLAFEGDMEASSYPALAKRVERYPFYSMQIYEHLPHRPAWPLVFHTASYTRRIRIGPVTVPVFLHDPLTLARNLGTLGEITGGRALLGVSRGAYSEYMPGPVNRTIQSVLEAIQCIDAILNGRGYRGDTFSFPQERRLGWLRRHGAEIYVGTSGPKMASRASRLEAVRGIVVDNLWDPKYARTMRAVIDDSANQSKRESRVELIARPFTLVAKNRAESEKRMLPILSRYLPELVGDSPMLANAGLTPEALLALSRNPPKAPPAFLHSFAALGTPDDVIEQTAQMLAAGVDQVCFGYPLGPDLPAAIRLLGENVIPHFPRSQGA